MSLSNTQDWGVVAYADAFERQKQWVQQRIDGERKDTLIFTSHPAVYTMGTRKDSQKNLLWDQQTLKAEQIAVHKTNRGGDITYHGPGQIVGYPIINLSQAKDLHRYLRDLEQVLINALGCLGLATAKRQGKTGIWLQDRKIAAIGVAVRRWVTYHGFALNVNTNLKHFQGIVPCGISSKEGTVTSVQAELGYEIDLEEVKKLITLEFWKIFSKYNTD